MLPTLRPTGEQQASPPRRLCDDHTAMADTTSAFARGTLLAVALGGAAGALLRWRLDSAAPAEVGAFPVLTLTINVVGAFALALVHASGRSWFRWPAQARAFVGPGLLGGFTTFSAYALQTRDLLAGGHPVAALGYLVATPVAALLAVEVALRVVPGSRR